MLGSYNNKNTKAALVGNWVEEDALRDRTGYARRKVPTPLFASDRKESRVEPTHKRVMEHDSPVGLNCNSHASEMVPPPFETTLQASTRYADYAVDKIGSGPRTSLRDQHLIETARRLHSQQSELEQQEQQRDVQAAAHTTVTKISYQPVDTAALLATKRLPRGSCARQVDPSVAHLTKEETDSIDEMKLQLLQGTTVTRYSYAITTGVGLSFPTTASDGSNAFGRSSTFTNELGDPTKRHGEATEPGSDHDERLGASSHQRSALKRLVQLVRNNPDTANRLEESLRRSSEVISDSQKNVQPQHEENCEYIELREFRSAFTSAGAALPAATVVRGLPAILTDKEVIHIFMYFDVDNIGAIQLSPFIDYCSSFGEKVPFKSQHLGTRR
ncbi:hypothetical protein PHYBOEH_003911 [Phytophthora boehmeriae]|uniref:EF-hand domain-containing protein n=1 Tax=Phytophthora boehmeriae TaxID=109152 RepID=A0A8T1WU91_9STRA|nr:hypothetical protein PHYBOEH_003911 [Phytophthora boehmeriae]